MIAEGVARERGAVGGPEWRKILVLGRKAVYSKVIRLLNGAGSEPKIAVA